MKNLILWLFVAIAILSGCKKTEDIINPQTSGMKPKSVTYPTISCWNGMLHFASMEDVQATLTALEDEENLHLKTFVDEYGSLEEEEFNQTVEEQGFIEEQPLIDFENQFSCYNSLRKDIADKEMVWLENDILDENSDPDNHFIEDEHIRTILNDKTQIRIGDDVYVHYEHCNAVYNYATFTGTEQPCNEEKGTLCKSGRRIERYETSSNGKKRTKMVVSHQTYFFNIDRRVTARLKNYQKRTLGGWKIAYHNGYNKTKVYGLISDNPGDCTKSVDFNPQNYVTYSWYAKKLKHYIHVQTRTSTDWVKGDIQGANGSHKTVILSFNN